MSGSSNSSNDDVQKTAVGEEVDMLTAQHSVLSVCDTVSYSWYRTTSFSVQQMLSSENPANLVRIIVVPSYDDIPKFRQLNDESLKKPENVVLCQTLQWNSQYDYADAQSRFTAQAGGNDDCEDAGHKSKKPKTDGAASKYAKDIFMVPLPTVSAVKPFQESVASVIALNSYGADLTEDNTKGAYAGINALMAVADYLGAENAIHKISHVLFKIAASEMVLYGFPRSVEKTRDLDHLAFSIAHVLNHNITPDIGEENKTTSLMAWLSYYLGVATFLYKVDTSEVVKMTAKQIRPKMPRLYELLHTLHGNVFMKLIRGSTATSVTFVHANVFEETSKRPEEHLLGLITVYSVINKPHPNEVAELLTCFNKHLVKPESLQSYMQTFYFPALAQGLKENKEEWSSFIKQIGEVAGASVKRTEHNFVFDEVMVLRFQKVDMVMGEEEKKNPDAAKEPNEKDDPSGNRRKILRTLVSDEFKSTCGFMKAKLEIEIRDVQVGAYIKLLNLPNSACYLGKFKFMVYDKHPISSRNPKLLTTCGFCDDASNFTHKTEGYGFANLIKPSMVKTLREDCPNVFIRILAKYRDISHLSNVSGQGLFL